MLFSCTSTNDTTVQVQQINKRRYKKSDVIINNPQQTTLTVEEQQLFDIFSENKSFKKYLYEIYICKNPLLVLYPAPPLTPTYVECVQNVLSYIHIMPLDKSQWSILLAWRVITQ